MDARFSKMRQQYADARRCEGWCEQTSLAAPIGSFGKKQPRTTEWARNAPETGRASVVRRIGYRDAPHGFRVIYKKSLDAHDLIFSNQYIEGIVWPDREAGLGDVPQQTPKRQVFRI